MTLFASCARTTQPAGEAATAPTPQQRQVATATPAQAKSEQMPAATQPATLAEAQSVVAHIYRDAVVVAADHATPFVVGDFNGDDSQDIAVVVRPGAGKLPKLNSEYANWFVEDPRKVLLPEVHRDVKVLSKRPEPVIIRQGDLLLAVIHGYRKDGWRDPLASQTYLLKNAVGSELKSQSAQSALSAVTDKGASSQLRGDVIRETLADSAGFIYWTGAKYAWASSAIH